MATEATSPERLASPGKRRSVLFVPYLDANPYQSMLASELGQKGVQVKPGFSLRAVPLWGKNSPDVVHLHWLPPVENSRKGRLKLWYFHLKLRLLQLSGTKIVWTVHNLRSHEDQSQGVEQELAKVVANVSSRIIVHSPIAAEMVRHEFSVRDPDKVVSIPHGNYIQSYPNTITREEARRRLGLSQGETVFLFLGLIRPYKGVNDLVDQFKKLGNPSVRLVLAGKPINQDSVAELEERIGQDGRIKLALGYVPDVELQSYFNSADVVVFPYKQVLTSGAVVLGMSFGKACIAPKIGCIPDYLDERGGFLYEEGGGDALYSALLSAVERRDQLENMGNHNLSKAKAWDWAAVSAQTSEQYQ